MAYQTPIFKILKCHFWSFLAIFSMFDDRVGTEEFLIQAQWTKPIGQELECTQQNIDSLNPTGKVTRQTQTEKTDKKPLIFEFVMLLAAIFDLHQAFVTAL